MEVRYCLTNVEICINLWDFEISTTFKGERQCVPRAYAHHELGDDGSTMSDLPHCERAGIHHCERSCTHDFHQRSTQTNQRKHRLHSRSRRRCCCRRRTSQESVAEGKVKILYAAAESRVLRVPSVVVKTWRFIPGVVASDTAR